MLKLFEDWGHDWATVAIDNTHGWHRTVAGEKVFDGQHTIVFQVCKKTGKRRIYADDATEMGRKFAMEKHCDVARQRTIWVEGGRIDHYDPDKIVFVDQSYAPLNGFEDVIRNLKSDPDFEDLLKNKMVDDALGQLEVAIKLHINNQPKQTDDV